MGKKVIATVIKMGDKGTKVTEAQMLLRRSGSKLNVTGEFSIGMRSAVISFQKKNGLKETGFVDIVTWEKLHEQRPIKKLAVKVTAKKHVAAKPVLKAVTKGPAKKPTGRKKA